MKKCEIAIYHLCKFSVSSMLDIFTLTLSSSRLSLITACEKFSKPEYAWKKIYSTYQEALLQVLNLPVTVFLFLSMLFEYPYKLMAAYFLRKPIYLLYKVQKEYLSLILAYALPEPAAL